MLARYRMNAFSRSAVMSSSILELLEVMRQRRAADAGLGLDFVDDHAVGVRREEQADDAQPRLGSERREHVGVAGDVRFGRFHNYISTILEM